MTKIFRVLSLAIISHLLFVLNAHADSKADLIISQNKKVERIDKAMNDGKYSMLRFENIIEQIESIPPTVQFFYNPKNYKLVAVSIIVGHETWSKSFFYYFDDQESIIKYLEVVADRPDNPPKLAIIYNLNGDVLWKNTDEPQVAPSDLKKFFENAMKYQFEFSKY